MLTCLAYCLDQELGKAIDYLKEQVRVLKEQQEKDKRILLSNHQRRRLAAKAQQLTRGLLEQTTVLFTPETVLQWYRRLIAQKYDGSQNCKNPGRPKISQEIVDLVMRFKQENPRWGYTRIRDYLVYLGHKIGETTVKNPLGARLRSRAGPDPQDHLEGIPQEPLACAGACDLFSIELLVKASLSGTWGSSPSRSYPQGGDPRVDAQPDGPGWSKSLAMSVVRLACWQARST